MAIQGNIVNKSLFYSDNDRARQAESEIKAALTNETTERIAGDSQSTSALVAKIVINQPTDSDTVSLNLYNVEDTLISTVTLDVKNRQQLTSAVYNKTTHLLTLTAEDSTAIVCSLEDIKTEIEADITIEVNRAKAAEDALSTRITNEISRATNAESAVAEDITVERNRAISAESNLDTKITDEVAARTTADNALQSNIDSEIKTRASADETLTSAITSEASIRQSEDTKLQATIDALNANNRGGDGKYIKYIKQDKGLITAVSNDFDTVVDSSSGDKNAPTSKAVYDLISTLDLSQVGQDGYYLKFIKQENGQITAEKYAFETSIPTDNPSAINAPTAKAVDDVFDSLAGTYGEQASTYVSKLVQYHGLVTAYVEVRITSISEYAASNKLVTEAAVVNFVDGKFALLTTDTFGTPDSTYITSFKQDNGKITNVTVEERVTAISTNSNNLVTESAVKNYVDAETTRAANAENVLTTALNNEVSRAQIAEQANASNISAETSNREAADTVLKNNIDTKVDKLTTASVLPRAYIQLADGTETGVEIADNPTGLSLVSRNANADILVNATPLTDNSAISKVYADTKVTKIDSISVEDVTKAISSTKNVNIALSDFGIKITDYTEDIPVTETTTIRQIVNDVLDGRTYTSAEVESLYEGE